MSKMLCEVQFATRMHSKGINLRHMGVVRQKATDKDLRSFILANAIARVLKNMLRAKLRSILRTNQVFFFSLTRTLAHTPNYKGVRCCLQAAYCRFFQRDPIP